MCPGTIWLLLQDIGLGLTFFVSILLHDEHVLLIEVFLFFDYLLVPASGGPDKSSPHRKRNSMQIN